LIYPRDDYCQSKLTHHAGVKSVDNPVSRKFYEFHSSLLAWLESDSGAGGNIQAKTARLFAIEVKRSINLVKMIVRADLYWPITSVGYGERDRLAAGIQLDIAWLCDDFTRTHNFFLV
jgi:hypothetical protein